MTRSSKSRNANKKRSRVSIGELQMATREVTSVEAKGVVGGLADSPVDEGPTAQPGAPAQPLSESSQKLGSIAKGVAKVAL